MFSSTFKPGWLLEVPQTVKGECRKNVLNCYKNGTGNSSRKMNGKLQDWTFSEIWRFLFHFVRGRKERGIDLTLF